MKRSIPAIFFVYPTLLSISLWLYLIGIKPFLFLVLVAGIVLCFPFPAILGSLYARTISAIVMFYGVFQILAYLQFFLLPASGFKVISIAATATIATLYGLRILHNRSKNVSIPTIFSRNDFYATITALVFVLPIAVFCYGPNGAYHSASIGGIQAIDGANHYTFIAKSTEQEGLKYKKGDNYPIGYHVTTGFINDSLGLSGSQLSWTNGVRVYILQYLSLSFLLGFGAYYLVTVLSTGLEIRSLRRAIPRGIATALAVGAPLTIFYLLPFLYNGFLSYFYICATVVFGLLYASEIRLPVSDIPSKQVNHSKWLAGFLFLTFAASANWPLLAPAFLLTGFLYATPARLLDTWRVLLNWRALCIALLAILHLLTIYIQSKYSTISTSQSLNLTGSLYGFHFGVIALCAVLIIYVVSNSKIERWLAAFVANTFTPLLLLVSGLMLYQYFEVGEVRYYVIKCAYLLEIMTLILLVSIIIVGLVSNGQRYYRLVLLSLVLPFGLFLALIGLSSNPVKDARSLFRSYSTEQKPPLFDNDVSRYVVLGKESKLQDFNSTSLHYNSTEKKFYSHMQIAYWANTIRYNASRDDQQAAAYNLEIYQNLLFGTFTSKEQGKLIQYVNDSAKVAANNKHSYYIVTDKASYQEVEDQFGKISGVKVVY